MQKYNSARVSSHKGSFYKSLNISCRSKTGGSAERFRIPPSLPPVWTTTLKYSVYSVFQILTLLNFQRAQSLSYIKNTSYLGTCLNISRRTFYKTTHIVLALVLLFSCFQSAIGLLCETSGLPGLLDYRAVWSLCGAFPVSFRTMGEGGLVVLPHKTESDNCNPPMCLSCFPYTCLGRMLHQNNIRALLRNVCEMVSTSANRAKVKKISRTPLLTSFAFCTNLSLLESVVTKIKHKCNYTQLETLKEFLHFPREYVDIPTLHTHMVNGELPHHPPSIHLTSTIFWLKRERKMDWLRAPFTEQSRHWSVRVWWKRTKKN